MLRIGMLGFGTVGAGVARLLMENAELLTSRVGLPMRLVRVATRTPSRALWLQEKRDNAVDLTDDLDRVVYGDDIDVVVEVIGGLTPAFHLVEAALKQGKDVVTANKALLAERGNDLLRIAHQQSRDLGFEAAVAGAVPIVKTLKEGLAADRIQSLYGILNGTCNYILTQMCVEGKPFQEVLQEAQQLGYAEADPTFDVDGIDAAHKLTLLAAIAFGVPLSFKDIYIEGIRSLSEVDISWASEMGYRIKLLAIAKATPLLELRVHPTLVSQKSVLASVEGVFNAVFVQGDHSGETLYYGRGAGEKPTASAVVSDLVEIARNRRVNARRRVAGLSFLPDRMRTIPTRPMGDLSCCYYLRLAVVDRPGVLADITAILKRYAISIDAFHQKGWSPMKAVPLVMITHETTERRVQAALSEINALESVLEPPHLIRIEAREDA